MNLTLLGRLAQGAALATIALAVATGPTKAVEIDFGALTPSPGCAKSSSAADDGLICANSQTFTANGHTFTATGFSDAFLTPSALTFKPETGNPLGPPFNDLAESGLGENAAGATSCTDVFSPHKCEIAGAASVAVVSSSGTIDAIVGSVQSGENFKIFTGSSIATLTLVSSGSGGSCTPGPVAQTCLITFAPALVVGVESGGVGDVLLTSVSQAVSHVPEPATLALLGTALVGIGLARRRRR